MTRRPSQTAVLPLALLLAAAGGSAAAGSVGAALVSIHHVSASAGHIVVAGIAFSYPALNGAAWALLGVGLLGAYTIASALGAMLRQHRAYRSFLAQLRVVGRFDDRPDVHVIVDRRPQAFCAGYLRPRVYVSTAALELLTPDELEAVLAHEHHHRQLRDPLRLAGGRVVSQALFFIPALRALFGRYSHLAELNADGAAARTAPGGRAALASALLVFDASGAGISPERVDSLLGQHAAWRPPWRLMATSVAAVSSLTAVTWGTTGAAAARATFNLPFLSSRPCLVMLTLLPLIGAAIVIGRRALVRRVGRR